MRDEFEVKPLDVAAASRRVAAAAAALGRAHPDQALSAAAGACPNSLLKPAGLAAAKRWGESLRVATADLRRTAEALSRSATVYTQADERAAGRNIPV